MVEVKMSADGRSWDVVWGSQVETFATIEEANDRRFELKQAGKAPATILYFKATGEAVTKRPRQCAS